MIIISQCFRFTGTHRLNVKPRKLWPEPNEKPPRLPPSRLLPKKPLLPGLPARKSALPTPLAAPIFPLVLAGALGLSNGFIGSLAMMHAPRRAPQRSRDEAGGLMALFLVSGCAAGALAGLGLQALACGCNPLAQKDAR